MIMSFVLKFIFSSNVAKDLGLSFSILILNPFITHYCTFEIYQLLEDQSPINPTQI